MTVLDDEAAPDGETPVSDGDEPSRGRGRRRPAPPANWFFRYVFPVLVVVGGLIVFLLWRDGTKAVLDSTDGEEIVVVNDPTEPGFLAFTTPTPTLIVAHTDDADRLVGVSVLAQTALEGGASLTVLSGDLLLPDITGVVLTQTYADGGVEALETAIAEWFGAGFTDDPMVMSTERLASFFAQVEPIPFALVDDLVIDDGEGGVEVVYGTGERAFASDDLAAVYEWRNPGEPDATRFDRQRDVWEAWLSEIAEAENLLEATLPFDEGLPPYLRAMATGTADITIPPIAPLSFDREVAPVYVLAEDDAAWPGQRALETIPLPIASSPGARPIVAVLDGTGDASNRAAALPAVVAAGAEVTIIGNAFEFGVERTVVAYHLEENAAMAADLASTLGVDVVFEENPNEVVDLTVTIGANP